MTRRHVVTGRAGGATYRAHFGRKPTAEELAALEKVVEAAVQEMEERPAAGYAGQRYEVRYIQEGTGQEKVMGWCNAADGGGLMRSAMLWTEVAMGGDGKRRAWVVDLRPEEGG